MALLLKKLQLLGSSTRLLLGNAQYGRLNFVSRLETGSVHSFSMSHVEEIGFDGESASRTGLYADQLFAEMPLINDFFLMNLLDS